MARTPPTMITNLPRRFVSLYSISIEVESASRTCDRCGTRPEDGQRRPGGHVHVAGAVSRRGYGGRYGRVVPRRTANRPGGVLRQGRTPVRFRSRSGRIPIVPDFKFVAPFQPTGDQPQAIERLTDGLQKGLDHQVLLGAT